MIIGKSSKKAFELFSEANSLENEAIDIFEKLCRFYRTTRARLEHGEIK